MFAPVTGEILADVMCQHPTSFDLSELSMQRFKKQTTFEQELSVV
jgi:glycine/D-amino acid oxidase-like deaminating enzyme